MDSAEASVLATTIRYLKYLQERVAILEEQARKAEVVPQKTLVMVVDKAAREFTSTSTDHDQQQQPAAVEARQSHNNVLLRIQCEKRKGVLVKIVGEVEKLNLCVVNASMVSFGSLSLDITIFAEKEKKFCFTMKEIEQILGGAMYSANFREMGPEASTDDISRAN